MRKIKELREADLIALEDGYLNGKKAHYRNRCKSILMSHSGYTVPEIARFFETRTRTVYTWFNRWEEFGLAGLVILPGRGRKATLDLESTIPFEVVEEAVKEHPQNLNGVARALSIKFGITISKGMLTRYLKKKDILGND